MDTWQSIFSSHSQLVPVDDHPIFLVLLEAYGVGSELELLAILAGLALGWCTCAKSLARIKSRGWKCSALTLFTEAMHALLSHVHPGELFNKYKHC
jgi:hypothetical protein